MLLHIKNANGRTISSVTVDGNSAALDHQFTSSGWQTACISYPGASAGTHTVDITFSSGLTGSDGINLHCWTATGTGLVFDSGSEAGNHGTFNNTINKAANGVTLFGFLGGTNSRTITSWKTDTATTNVDVTQDSTYQNLPSAAGYDAVGHQNNTSAITGSNTAIVVNSGLTAWTTRVSYSAASTVDYSLSVDYNAFVWSGQAAAVRSARSLIVTHGAYGLTGEAVSFQSGKSIVVAAGHYIYSGQAAHFTAPHVLAADTGYFTQTGIDAVLYQIHRQFLLHPMIARYTVSGGWHSPEFSVRRKTDRWWSRWVVHWQS
jgi:hypothetical protein